MNAEPESPLAPVTDVPTLDALPYEEYRKAREGKEFSPAAESPGDGSSADTPAAASPVSGTDEAPGDAPSAAGETEPRARDETGKFAKKAKPRSDTPARIQELTYKQKAAEERAEAAERRARELEERYSRPQAQEPRQAPVEPQYTRPRPAIEEFTDQSDPYLAWQEALVDWKLEQRDAHAYRQTQVRQAQERRDSYQQRVEQARQQYQDFDAVVSNPALPKLTPVLAEAILSSERGPDLAYYLGTHPEVYAQLVEDSLKTSIEAVPLMRRYLESVSPGVSPTAGQGTGSASATRYSRAAPPPKPVGNGAPTARDESPDALPYEQYKAMREKQWRAGQR